MPHHKTPKTFADRLNRLRSALRKKSIPAMLVAHPTDYFYLTGFTGEDSAVLVTSKS
ncbi:MAG: Xaa-Pro dipeptidase, partial [Planctomycetes bacterium]|nr:Xaa-Pro dipeptidase [Planctomycetota bacterium]